MLAVGAVTGRPEKVEFQAWRPLEIRFPRVRARISHLNAKCGSVHGLGLSIVERERDVESPKWAL